MLVAKPVEMGLARAAWLMLTQRDLFLIGHGKKLQDIPAPGIARKIRRATGETLR